MTVTKAPLYMIAFALLSFSVAAQQTGQSSRTIVRALSGADTTLIHLNEDSLILRTIFTEDTVLRERKSTTVALLTSLVLPGCGQIYNGSYWKTPIVWGFGYYFFSVYRDQHQLYIRYRDSYRQSITSTVPQGDGNLKYLRDAYRDQRDTFGWYLAVTYIITALDAYVDASLFNFEVSPNLQPMPGSQQITVRIALK